MRFSPGKPRAALWSGSGGFGALLALLIVAGCLMSAQSEQFAAGNPQPDEKLVMSVEWRLIHAGVVTIEKWPYQTTVKLESAGIVSTLMRIQDFYQVRYEGGCATGSSLESMEGKRHHEAVVTYDGSRSRASYLERDLFDNKILKQTGTEIPSCVYDVPGAFAKLRGMNLAPGQSTQIPVSDGRKYAAVKVTAQEREDVRTPLGVIKAIRYEADLMNGVVYTRKGDVLLWLSDDARRLPVQIRLRTNFPISTVTLTLEKEEHR